MWVVFLLYFCRELYGNYDLYLRLKTEEVKSASVPPKAVEAIFTQVAMATSGQVSVVICYHGHDPSGFWNNATTTTTTTTTTTIYYSLQPE